MIKAIILSCIALCGSMLGLYGLYAFEKLSLIGFALLSCLVIIALTVGHIYMIVSKKVAETSEN